VTPVAVTFDFWNTLAHEPGGLLAGLRLHALRAVMTELGGPVADAELREHLAAAGRLHHAAWTAGEIFQPEQAAEHLAEALGAGLAAAARARIATAFLDAPAAAELRLAAGVADCLRRLRGTGARLGIVCDVGLMRSPLLRAFLEREGVLELFDGWAFSDEVGCYKPAPAIFEAALAQLGVRSPADAVHVGDLRRTDVAGAAALGMRTIRYRGIADDPGPGVEADHVADHHRDVLALLAPGVA